MSSNILNPVLNNSASVAQVKALNTLIEKARSLLEQFSSDLDLVSAHNVDSEAHPDIRESTVDIDDVNSSVTTYIAEHNALDSAHTTLIDALRTELSDTSTTINLIEAYIKTHDENTAAHSDIRADISEIKLQLGSVDLTDMYEQLTEIIAYVNTDIASSISDLQTKDAEHDSSILLNSKSIEELEESVNTLDTTVSSLYTVALTNQATLDTVKLQAHALNRNEVFGYVQALEDGVNLESFATTLPTYVGADTEVTFTVNNIQDSTGGSNITCAITEVSDGWSLSPTSGISNAAGITATVDSDTSPDTILYFTLEITDNTSNVVTSRTMNVLVTTPTNADNITITGLPSATEPGTVYTVSISNPSDTAGTYTYSIQGEDAAYVFSKTEDIATGETFTIAISESAERGASISFQLLISNNVEVPLVKTFSVAVNPLPDTSGFTHTMPSTVVPGTSYTVKFYGVTSVTGLPATYDISYSGDDLVFSKTSGIITNENILVTISSGATRGAYASFNAIINDGNGNEIPVLVGTTVNVLPDSATINTTLPSSTEGGVILAMTITGGSDAEDGSNVNYTIDSATSGFSFSKINNVTSSDVVYVTISKVSSEVTKTFLIYAVDMNSEASADPKQISVTVVPIYTPDTPTITYPVGGDSVLSTFTMLWTSYSQTVDMT